MSLQLRWPEIALRLTLAFLAGLVVGLDRRKTAEAAGLRTTILVSLAACVAMIQANLLLATAGKAPDSFSVLDLMRLPLGILTGMGFIGAGAILKRGRRVLGVTTAASLWFVTVIGLCMGGGQLGLGLAALGLAVVVLAVLKHLELWLQPEHRGVLRLTCAADSLSREQVVATIAAGGGRALAVSSALRPGAGIVRYEFLVGWQGEDQGGSAPPFVDHLARVPQLEAIKWTPAALGGGHPEGE